MRPAPILLALVLTAAAVTAPAAGAQPFEPGPPVAPDSAAFGRGAGAALVLTNSGFGLGGFYRHAVGRRTSLQAEIAIGTGKNEREITFYNRLGRKDVPNKMNYLLLLPVRFGAQTRLFQAHIEDNFRPFVQLLAGPTLGWEYPYFDDCNGDGVFDRNTDCDGDGTADEDNYDAFSSLGQGSLHVGVGGMLAIGANFGQPGGLAQGVRLGYAFTYFADPIQLLEPGVAPAQHFFGTPSVTIVFGRIF